MEIFFKDITFFSYKRLSTIISIIGDLILVAYLNAYFSVPDTFNNSIDLALQILAKEGQQLILPSEERLRLFNLMTTWVRTMLVTYLCIHLIIYWFYYCEKRWAQIYVKIINWMAAPTALLMAYGLMNNQMTFALVFFLLALFFIWNILGQRKFLRKNKNANTVGQ